jgi:hypothetical protein
MSTRIFSIISVLSLLGTLLVAVLLWRMLEREQANYTTLANRIIAVTFVTQREELATKLREILSKSDFNDLRFEGIMEEEGRFWNWRHRNTYLPHNQLCIQQATKRGGTHKTFLENFHQSCASRQLTTPNWFYRLLAF